MSTEPRSEELLRKTLSVVAEALWNGRTGEHLWSIPVDQKRDWDCILSDAIDELVQLRQRLAAQEAVLGQMRQALAWADRQFSYLVTEDDGDGVFLRRRLSNIELTGFGAGRARLRAALASCPTPPEPSNK